MVEGADFAGARIENEEIRGATFLIQAPGGFFLDGDFFFLENGAAPSD
jgi:hypothetical protein